MAWYGRSNNGDEYGRTVPGYGQMGYSDHVHHPVILDSNGTKHSMVGYTANYNSERYEAKPDQYHTNYGKHNNLDSKTNNKYRDIDKYDDDDDDVICNDGVCFKNPREGSERNYFKDENYNENEKHKGNGYNPPTYTVPITTQPRSKDHSNNYYESNINKPTATNPPQFNAPPRRDQRYPETIDSTEARRRYGVVRPGAGTGSGYDEGQYARTIDSKEDARLYTGLRVPRWY